MPAFAASGRQLAAAEIYLPIDPFEVGAGKPLKNALHLDKKMYAESRCRALR